VNIQGHDQTDKEFDVSNSTDTNLLVKEILDQCEPQGDCLVWTKSTRKGYGWTRINGQSWATHRLVAYLIHGEPPENKNLVLHSCDNPPCCNPAHLRWGSQFENMQDVKLRNRRADLRGSRNGRAKLNDEKVALIRALRKNGITTLEIAALFQISNQIVSRICRNEAWIDSQNR
jgi:hypothetical protein